MVIKKCVILREVSLKENVHPEQVTAVGDGANDLEMLSSVSLGITFNAKRYSREHAACSLSLPNLEVYYIFKVFPAMKSMRYFNENI